MRFLVIYQQLKSLLINNNYDEIFLNGARATFGRIANRVASLPNLFECEDAFFNWLLEFAQYHRVRIDALHPLAGGVAEGGLLRWHAVLPPISANEVLFVLRRQRFDEITLDHFCFANSAWRESLEIHLLANRPLVISGQPGVGKSSFLQALLSQYCADERIIFLDSVAESQISNPRWLSLTTREENNEGQGRVTLEQVFAASLRLSPDRVVVSELRSDEIVCFNQALYSFANAPLTTLHAANVEMAVLKFEEMAKRYGLQSLVRERQIAFVYIQRALQPEVSALYLTN